MMMRSMPLREGICVLSTHVIRATTIITVPRVCCALHAEALIFFICRLLLLCLGVIQYIHGTSHSYFFVVE